MVGAIGIFVGVIVSVCFGFFLDKTRAYKKSLLFCSLLPILTPIGWRHELPYCPENFSMIIYFSFAFTAGAYILIPLCMVFTAEIAHPLQPSLINGTIQIFS